MTTCSKSNLERIGKSGEGYYYSEVFMRFYERRVMGGGVIITVRVHKIKKKSGWQGDSVLSDRVD